MRRLLLSCLMLPACATPTVELSPLSPEIPVPSAIHAKDLPERAAGEPLRFLIGGHIYGDSKKKVSPARSLVAAIDDLCRSGADLMVCCGDSFRSSTAESFDQTAGALGPLPFPVFNAVGNHDVAVRTAYEARFGETYGAFVHAGCAFVLLDTELSPWEIDGEQLVFLGKALAVAKQRSDIRAVFCFGHKLVHCQRKRYFEVMVGSNALDGLVRVNQFGRDVLPLLADVAKTKPVFWCAGDIGLAHTLHAMVDRDPVSGVTFMATGLGDLPRDALLQVDVVAQEVSVRLRSLSDGAMSGVAGHGLAKWRERFFPAGLSPQLQALRAALPE